MYYLSVTAHGTLMALVFTTFFIMGFGYVVAQHALGGALADAPDGLGRRSGLPSWARWPPGR